MAGNPFAVNWNDKAAVLAYCESLNRTAKIGHECVVIKFHDRENYNITFVGNLSQAKYETAKIVLK